LHFSIAKGTSATVWGYLLAKKSDFPI
jgi:hypothetical protein